MSKATVAERKWAEMFLRYLGGNVSNLLLVSAVIGWVRQEGGLNRYSGYNPLNIRHSKYESGRRRGHPGFAAFSTAQRGAYASAHLLLDAGKDYRGYWKIVQAAKRGAKTVAQQQDQAKDFLGWIALSKWDASHYGLGKNPDPNNTTDLLNSVSKQNHLILRWAEITSLPALPPEAPKQTKPKKPKTLPPEPLQPPSPPNLEYLDPKWPRTFYDATHHGSDLGNLPVL